MSAAVTGPLLVGVDLGSQSAKVVVHDAAGAVVAQGRRALRATATPRPGVVEHPDDDLWDALGAATREAVDAVVTGGGSLEDLTGLGLCGIRNTRALVRADGALAAPVISWMDERASRPHERDTEPDGVRWVTASSGYLTMRLTGQAVDSLAADQGQWSLEPDRWDRERLMELAPPGAVVGAVTAEAAAHTGLPVGLPVVATANDKAVEALGAGLREPGDLLLSLGTYAAGMVVVDEPAAGARASWSNPAAVPGRFLQEAEGVRRGMWTASWVRDLLASDEASLDAGAVRLPPGADGLLTVLDWLAPTDAVHRRGAFVGLDARHGPHHLWRSVLESLAMTLLRRSAAMTDELGRDVERVLLSGGGARSAVLRQSVADASGLPVHVARADSAAGLGAAICAAVGTGVHPNADAAQEAMVALGEQVVPDPAAHRTYVALGEALAELPARLDPVLRAVQEATRPL